MVSLDRFFVIQPMYVVNNIPSEKNKTNEAAMVIPIKSMKDNKT